MKMANKSENGKEIINYQFIIQLFLFFITFPMLAISVEYTFPHKNIQVITKTLAIIQVLISLYVSIAIFITNSKVRGIFKNSKLNFTFSAILWIALTILLILKNLGVLFGTISIADIFEIKVSPQ